MAEGKREAQSRRRPLRRVARLVVLLAILSLAVATAWRLAAPWLGERLAREIEVRLAAALHQPVAVGRFELSVAPPVVRVLRVRIGPGGSALRAALLEVRLRPYTSLMQMRPVAEVTVAGVDADIGAFRSPGDERESPHERRQGGPARLPAFRLRRVEVAGLRLRFPGEHELAVRLGRASGEAEVEARRRRLAFSVAARGVRVRRRGHELAAERLSGAGWFRPGQGLYLRSADIEGPGLLVRARRAAQPPERLHVAARIDLSRLGWVHARTEGFAGLAEIDGELEGSVTNPAVRAGFTASGLQWRGRRIGDAVGRVERSRERLRVERLELRGPAGEVTVSGRLGLSGALPLDAEITWQGLSVPAVAAMAGRQLGVDLRADGAASVVGTLRPLSFDAAGRGEVRAPSAPEAAWAATLQRGRHEVRAYLQVEQRPGNFVQLAAAVGKGGALRGAVRAELADTDAVRALWIPVDLPAVRGRLEVEARIGGTRSQPEAEGRVRGEHLRAVRAEIDAADLRFRLRRGALEDAHAVLQAGGGMVRADGRLAFGDHGEGRWALQIEDLGVDWLRGLLAETAGIHLPLEGGTLSGKAQGSGSARRPAVEARVEARHFSLGPEPFDQLAVSARAAWPSWRGEVTARHVGGGTIHALVAGSAARQLQVRFTTSPWELASLRSLPAAGGTVRGEGFLAGLPSRPRGRVLLSGEDLAWDTHFAGGLRATLEAEDGRWRAVATVADGVQVDASVDTRETGYPARLAARWVDAHLGRLVRPDPTFHVVTSGGLEAQGPLASPRQWKGTATLERLVVRQMPYEIVAVKPVRARLAGGAIHLEPVELNVMGDPVRVTATAGLDGGLAAQAQGSLDLRVLELWGEPIASARGAAQIDVAVRREPGRPLSLSGGARVSQAALDVGLPSVLTETNGELAFEGSAVRVLALEGETAGGRYRLHGTIDLREGPDLEWELSEVSPDLIDWLEAEASGRGRVAGGWHHLRVSGEVELLRVLYGKDISVVDMIPWFHRRVARRAREETGRRGPVVDLDLHVRAPGEIFVDNNFARIEMRADLRVRGTVAQVELEGPIEVVEGQVDFRGRRFEITRGIIEFRRGLGLRPYLNITAETVVTTREAEYTITAQVSGTTDKVRVELFSDEPGLAQRDLVSLLTFGKTVAELQQGGGAGVGLQDLLVLAPKAVQGRMAEELRQLLPVDRVEIQSALSRETGSFEPRVMIGKDFTEDLSALVSTSVGANPERRVQLEYRVTPRISLLGSWESQTEGGAGAFGGEVKFRYEFLRLRGYSLLRALLGRDTLDAR